jgi:ATP-dependent helicase STH1/SNF2
MYRSMVDEETTDIETGETKQLGNLMIQLRKICNHPFLILTHNEELPVDTLIRSSGKLELLDRILPKLLSFGHRMLVFSQFTTTLDILERYLKAKAVKYLRLDGSTKYEDRCTYTEAFNKEDS